MSCCNASDLDKLLACVVKSQLFHANLSKNAAVAPRPMHTTKGCDDAVRGSRQQLTPLGML